MTNNKMSLSTFRVLYTDGFFSQPLSLLQKLRNPPPVAPLITTIYFTFVPLITIIAVIGRRGVLSTLQAHLSALRALDWGDDP